MKDRYKVSCVSDDQFIIIDINENDKNVFFFKEKILAEKVCNEFNKIFYDGCYIGWEKARIYYEEIEDGYINEMKKSTR